MKHFPLLYHSVTVLAAAVLTASCGGVAGVAPEDFTTRSYTPAYARGFDIRGMEGSASKLITVRNPWQGASDTEHYLIVLRGEDQTTKEYPGQAVKAPVERVVCMSSSHVALFDAVGETPRIKGVSGIDYISNDYIRKHREEVRDVGYDTNIDFELLASMRPDVVLLYGVTGDNSTITGKLRELRIPYLYIGDYMETSPLGKAEWMVVAAELCDCRAKGVEKFQDIAGRYEALKAQIAVGGTPRPKVMINTPYRDTWFMPSSRSYMIRLIEDAGGEYVYTKNSSDTSVAVDLEEAYLLANAADIWINVGPCNTMAELTAQNPRFAGIPAVRNHRVWNNNRRQTPAGGSDFWESGSVYPHDVLEDLYEIFRESFDPAQVPDDEMTVYYKRLY